MRWNCCGRRSTRRTMSEGSISDDSYTPNESSLTSTQLNPEVPRESDLLVIEAVQDPGKDIEDNSEITDSEENQIITECSTLSLEESDEMDPMVFGGLSSDMLEDQVRELQTQMARWNDENGPSMFHNHQNTNTILSTMKSHVDLCKEQRIAYVDRRKKMTIIPVLYPVIVPCLPPKMASYQEALPKKSISEPLRDPRKVSIAESYTGLPDQNARFISEISRTNPHLPPTHLGREGPPPRIQNFSQSGRGDSSRSFFPRQDIFDSDRFPRPGRGYSSQKFNRPRNQQLSGIRIGSGRVFNRYSSRTNLQDIGIIKTLSLKKPAACLSFVKSDEKLEKDTLLLINSDGELHAYEVKFDGNEKIEVTEVEAGKKVDLPSDFCHGQQFGKDRVYFWCRRHVLYCKKQGESEAQQFPLKADVKCFDSVVYNGIIFCVVGCVNGNVYFLEINVSSEKFTFHLAGLVNPAPIPVTNCAIHKVENLILAVFNHGPKVTTVRWELCEESKEVSSLKIKRELTMAGKSWYLSTDSVIGDFTNDISSLIFGFDGRKLLIVTNDRDFGVYVYKEEAENQGNFNWVNITLGGEASERPFGNEKESWILAIGLGDGSICFYFVDDLTSEFEEVLLSENFKETFSQSVTCLEFRRQCSLWAFANNEGASGAKCVLAAGSESGVVKVFSLSL
ncbi:hypothetical protein FO519_003233 [Halicephalobus sp. NKZ332]|nr:hypothetical protein FO519_003233 [Halicephalobus sp. NKZ332]